MPPLGWRGEYTAGRAAKERATARWEEELARARSRVIDLRLTATRDVWEVRRELLAAEHAQRMEWQARNRPIPVDLPTALTTPPAQGKRPRAKRGDGWTTRRAMARWMDADPCAYCGGPADEYDHIEPRKRGGGNGEENLVHACHSCNHEKSSRPLLLFLAIRAQRKADGTWRRLPDRNLPRTVQPEA